MTIKGAPKQWKTSMKGKRGGEKMVDLALEIGGDRTINTQCPAKK